MFSKLAIFVTLALPVFAAATSASAVARNDEPTSACCDSTVPVSHISGTVRRSGGLSHLSTSRPTRLPVLLCSVPSGSSSKTSTSSWAWTAAPSASLASAPARSAAARPYPALRASRYVASAFLRMSRRANRLCRAASVLAACPSLSETSYKTAVT